MRNLGTLRGGASVVLLVLAVTVGAASPAHADARPVALGEVSTAVVRGDAELHALLRSTLQTELAGLDFSRVRARPMILSVSLVRMDTESTASGAATTCVVSATLRTARGGNVFAVIEGRARADNDARGAMTYAVRGALGRIPDAMR